LDSVFKLFTGPNSDFFTAKDVSRVLKMLEYPLSKEKIDLMIWVSTNNKRKLTIIWTNKLRKKNLNLCTKETFLIKMAKNPNPYFMSFSF
jgi:hypothetical protein